MVERICGELQWRRLAGRNEGQRSSVDKAANCDEAHPHRLRTRHTGSPGGIELEAKGAGCE